MIPDQEENILAHQHVITDGYTMGNARANPDSRVCSQVNIASEADECPALNIRVRSTVIEQAMATPASKSPWETL